MIWMRSPTLAPTWLMASTSWVRPFPSGLQLSREAHDSQALERTVLTQAVPDSGDPILITIPCSMDIKDLLPFVGR
jgi:hypothetical protein